jgi:hypothetical protein
VLFPRRVRHLSIGQIRTRSAARECQVEQALAFPHDDVTPVSNLNEQFVAVSQSKLLAHYLR